MRKVTKYRELVTFVTTVTVTGTSYFLTKGTGTVTRYNFFVTSNALEITEEFQRLSKFQRTCQKAKKNLQK